MRLGRAPTHGARRDQPSEMAVSLVSFLSWFSFVILRVSFVSFVMKEVALYSVEIARVSDEVAEQSRVVHQFSCDQVGDCAFAFQHPVHA
jgi:hypothetical protein